MTLKDSDKALFGLALIESGDIQVITLALAWLSKDRPGWDDALRNVAKKYFGTMGENFYLEFQKIHNINQYDPTLTLDEKDLRK